MGSVAECPSKSDDFLGDPIRDRVRSSREPSRILAQRAAVRGIAWSFGPQTLQSATTGSVASANRRGRRVFRFIDPTPSADRPGRSKVRPSRSHRGTHERETTIGLRGAGVPGGRVGMAIADVGRPIKRADKV